MGRRPVEKMSPTQCQSMVTWVIFFELLVTVCGGNFDQKLKSFIINFDRPCLSSLTDQSSQTL